jgi:hypothetical protein
LPERWKGINSCLVAQRLSILRGSRGWSGYGKGSPAPRFRAMELITILNRCHRLRGFIYERAHFSADKKSIVSFR